MTVSLVSLKDIPVDFKINKSDLIDILIEEIRSPIEEKLNELEEKEKELTKAHIDMAGKFRQSHEDHNQRELNKLKKDKTVKSLKKALEAHYQCDFDYQYGCNNFRLSSEKPKAVPTGVQCPVPPLGTKYVILNHSMTRWEYTEEYQDLMNEQNKICDEKLQIRLEKGQLEYKLLEIDKNSRKYKVKILKQFLGQSEDGKNLLSMLDSKKTGQQILKQLQSK